MNKPKFLIDKNFSVKPITSSFLQNHILEGAIVRCSLNVVP